MGGQRGTELDVTFSGARLGDALEIVFYQPGITTLSIKKVNNNAVTARLKIAPDCALGLHDLRVRTATGISELRTFCVGALKEVDEVEPNNDFAKPQPIAMNVTVNGVADNEDVDYFVVEAKKGERISAEVEGHRLGIFEFDPYVAILNAKRFELGSSDDAALVLRDGFTSIIAPEDGKYIIQVRESAYSGNGACLYRLHVGNFPRRDGRDARRRQARRDAGRAMDRRRRRRGHDHGHAAGLGLRRIRPGAAGRQGGLPLSQRFRLTPLGNVIETEPNDDQAHATPFEAPMAVNGIIGKPGDVDHFVFKATKGQVFDIHCYARRIRSPLDPVMYLGKKGAGAMLGADDAIGPDSYFRFQAPETAEYVIWLVDQLGKGGPDYAYRIEVTPVAAKLAMLTAAEQIPLGTGVIVRRGAQGEPAGDPDLRHAGRLRRRAECRRRRPARRGDRRGPGDGRQPAGGPVLFSAKPDAPLAGSLATVTGKPVDEKLKVPSSFGQTSILVLGQNHVNVWSRTVDRLAVAVTEECPYTIEIVEPKVPLVRGGSMGLKVRAHPQAGLQGGDRGLPPLEPAGRRLGRRRRHPRGQGRGDHPHERRRRRRAADLEDRGQRRLGRRLRADHGLVAARQPDDLAALRQPRLPVGERRAGQGDRHGDQGRPRPSISRARPRSRSIGLPNKVTTDVKKITKDTDRPGLPHQDRQGLARRQPPRACSARSW